MNRGVEIDSDVADGPHSVILNQVTNGVAVRMAVLYLLAGGKPELAEAAKGASGGDADAAEHARPAAHRRPRARSVAGLDEVADVLLRDGNDRRRSGATSARAG